ncbi:PREDICTED: LYR motif-containing protein 4-like isoform X2 [Branchiostoma belcheri]|uniref:LYR motif-containing protein 4-like isoform X2 n=1 Tax=Branchiostoma belcheri TaxID=7741 RepID=A0A6P4ZFF3_BRABE|nr:PREDICTED: LYR motif-containing protein 4-like isoform X2 [Branchiostoma belcheri]KAI8520224.1 LYR motif-containing protein 4 [Branchiostoma belcheri]
MAASTRSVVLSLYKKILRESKNFSSYNFRMYALRRTRDGFRANKDVTDPAKIQELIKQAEDSLQVIKRQVVIGHLYSTDKLVIEKDTQS